MNGGGAGAETGQRHSAVQAIRAASLLCVTHCDALFCHPQIRLADAFVAGRRRSAATRERNFVSRKQSSFVGALARSYRRGVESPQLDWS
jgi:hypothetical protein